MIVKRRDFLAGVGALFVAGQLRGAEEQNLRAVVIGHTGRGDYGHGLDMVFAGQSRTELVALADPVEAGRRKAAARCKPLRIYADWREMLEREKPNLVSIAPRMTGERLEMIIGALSAGAHVICEKPFVRSPAAGDQVLALAKENNLKIAVTHQMRLAPSIVHLKKKIDDGLLGDLIEMNAFGKEDGRAGGEDMTVLGVHLFDLMRMFGGDPRWCSARVLERGHEATLADVKSASEDLGPILGSDINAQFSFDNGILGNFTSRGALRNEHGHWGIELVGSKATARIGADLSPFVWLKKRGKWEEAGRTDEWLPLDDDPGKNVPATQRTHVDANRRLVDDWLAAIAENREPVCSGANAARAVEMSHAVWRAALGGGRVALWLKERGHALGKASTSTTWEKIAPYFSVPAEFAGELGKFRSPLLFNDGTRAKTPEDWRRRRAEILSDWHKIMGAWPALIEKPKIEILDTARRENFTQKKVRVEISAGQMDAGYILIPDGPGPFPGIFVPFYEPETSTGQSKKPMRSFAYDLTRRGFVTLSIGSPGGDAYKPDTAGNNLQPLSYLGYVSANCYNALASLPEVDAKHVGVVGHSYGGKWAMFASCLCDKYAAAVWSDPGIVWDEARGNVNYWEKWYLGLDPQHEHARGPVTPDNPRSGAYKALVEGGHDLIELHALMAPRPFLVSGGSEDKAERWVALNHSIAVNKLLGYDHRVGLTLRDNHEPTVESNEAMYLFFEHFLMDK